jgi:hypothetical protein
MLSDHSAIKTIGDVAAASISVTALLKLLPAIAALLSIVWTALRVYEWFEGRFKRKR